MKSKAKECDELIRNHVFLSVGAGLIPVPVADLFAVSAIQLDMLRKMAKLYNLDFEEHESKAKISAVVTGGITRYIATRLLKLIPGVGTVIGGIAVSVSSGAATYALGEAFQRHFEAGGKFDDIDTDAIKNWYEEYYEKGKKIAADFRNNFTKTDKVKEIEEDDDDIDEKAAAENLKNMHDAGIISNKEYKDLIKRLNADRT